MKVVSYVLGTVGYGSDVQAFQPGDIIELEDAEAAVWIERGWAVALEALLEQSAQSSSFLR